MTNYNLPDAADIPDAENLPTAANYYPMGNSTQPLPVSVLGSNCAICLQSNLGTGPGPTVASWVNRVQNGNAVQGTHPSAPVLEANAFGSLPGVRFAAADAGLTLQLTTPMTAGHRPYAWVRARLDSLVHTSGDWQYLYQGVVEDVGGDLFSFQALPSGTFDAGSYWDAFAHNGDTYETLADDTSMLGVHTFQAACQQPGALVVDSRVTDGFEAINALLGTINRFTLNRSLAGGSAGYWTIGVLVMTYTQPTPEQIAAIADYCNNYGL